MTTRESMNRRPVLNGLELDELLHHHDLVMNHGAPHSRAKTRRNRRCRRQVRQALRNGDEN
jgi:hypothetical protein